MNSLKHFGLIGFSVLFMAAFSCGQNGPTQPTVSLTWTQSTSVGVVKNCVYRGSAAGVYQLPAIFCSTAPITSYTDMTATRGTTYHYAVTARSATTEGSFSNDATANVPTAPNAPALDPPTTAKKSEPGPVPGDLVASVKW